MILVVEDNPKMAEVFAKAMAGEGWDTTITNTCESAIESLSTGPYELAIVDLMLDGLDGVEFARRARAAGSDVPMIAVSGILEAFDQNVLRSVGFVAWLAKPLRITELVDLVRKHAHPHPPTSKGPAP
ncbi:MAG TPA: response regulator [Stellaceae bacterium]|jgi:DNA-binding response OmpR family regulator|nr:response regulator [Stellaceae bacterium]